MKLKTFTVIAIAIAVLAAIVLLVYLTMKPCHCKKSKDLEGDFMPRKRAELELLQYRDPVTGKIPEHIRAMELAYARTMPGSFYYYKKNGEKALGADWTQRGPVNIGGRTRALGIDILNENIILAGGVSSGMWRSTNGGLSWTPAMKSDQLKSISCLVQDTRKGKENAWYAGTGELWGNSARIQGDGIYKSVDNGKTWELLLSTSNNQPNYWESKFDYTWNIVVNPTAPEDKDEVYVASALGAILRTTDGGTNWESVLGGWGNQFSLFTDIAVTSKGIFYATLSQAAVENKTAAVKGIFRSVDGKNWTDITPQNMPPRYQRIVIGIAPSDENQVYFLAETPLSGKMTRNAAGDSLWHMLWKYTYLSGDGSKDGGKWEERTNYLPSPANIRGQMNSQSSYNLIIKVKPDDPNVVFIGATNLYRSNDGFTSDNYNWMGGYCPFPKEECEDTYRYPNQHADQHAIVFSRSNPNILYTGSDGGVHRTDNCMSDRVQWTSLNNGYFTTQFYSCAIDHSDRLHPEILGGLQDNGSLYTNSASPDFNWTDASFGDGLSCLIADGGGAYFTSQNTSTDPVAVKIWRNKLDASGMNIMRNRIDPVGALDLLWNGFIGLDPNNQDRMYIAGGKILWRNNDLSLIPFAESDKPTEIGWDSLPATRLDGPNSVSKKGGIIYAGAISKSPANIVYYGTTNGEIFRLDNADQGNPLPVNITGTNMPAGAFMSCIETDPADGNKVMVAFSNYNILSIFYSTDAGASWVSVSGNLEERAGGAGSGPAVNWVEILPVKGKNLYLAGTSTGLYSTAYLDGDFTVWQQEGATTIGNTVVKMIDSRQQDGYVAVATHGLGMFSSYITSLPSPPSAPKLLSPVNGTRGLLDEITLEWSKVDEASFYKLEIATDPDFQYIYLEKNGIRETNYKVNGLQQGLVNFYWRITAKSSGGESLHSEAWKFTSAVASPKLTSPLNMADSLGLEVLLNWGTVQGADKYHLQISNKAIFTQLKIDTVISINSFVLTGLSEGERCYWRVSSISEDGEGLFSKSWNFRVYKTTSVFEEVYTYKPVELKIAGANPFYENTTLEMFLSESRQVSLGLYDTRGRLVRNLASGYFSRGSQTLQLAREGLAQGVYYCLLESNGYKATLSIVILGNR